MTASRLFTRRLLAAPLGLVLALGLAACGGNPTVPAEERFDVPDYEYVIGPGDTMEWTNPR